MRPNVSIAVLSLMALAGCNRHSDLQQTARASLEPSGKFISASIVSTEPRRKATELAYEHSISIELSQALLPTRAHEIQQACATDTKFACTILDVSVRSFEDVPTATVRMRLAPTGVDSFIDAAAQNGKIVTRTTHAEDLADQVTDTDRELSLLTTHRDRLSGFLMDKSLKVDQLITVSRELATVQTQIEATTTSRVNLRRRIDTELLTIDLSIPRHDAATQRTPVADAMGSFGTQFTEAVAQVISFVASLIPWLIVIIPGVILIRLFWRAIGRWLARRETR